MKEESKKYPEGHFQNMWIGLGMALFSGLGVPLWLALDNPGLIGIGPAIGVAVGAAIGQSIEAKYKAEGKIRPLTEEEIEKQGKIKKFLIWGVALFIMGLAVFFAIMFLR
jgi:hypothetical protein